MIRVGRSAVLLRKAIACVLLALLWAPQTAVAQTGRPNILVIQTDDFDVPTFQVMLQAGLLPNIKRHIVDVGFEFSSSYAVGSFGAVTRASFLTGQYPWNHREIGSEPVVGEPPKFNQNTTLAAWMKAAGYSTGYIGRYTTGYGLPGTTPYIPQGWDYWIAPVDPSTWSMYSYALSLGGIVADFSAFNAYQTDVLTFFAGEVLKTMTAAKPFFVMYTPVVFNREMWPGPTITNECPDPSVPYIGGNFWGVTQRPAERHLNTLYGNPELALPNPPSFNEADVSDKPSWVQGLAELTAEDMECRQRSYWRRLEAIRAVDDAVGYFVALLQAKSLLANTVIVFTADNGYMNGQHRIAEKTPAYEESIRVPLYIRPRAATGPVAINRLVLNIDVAPTIAHLAGATPTLTVDGRSLVPLMQTPAMAWRKAAIFQHLLPSQTVEGSAVPHFFALRLDDGSPAKFVTYPTVTSGVAGEFYDLATDPYELQNLFGDAGRQSQISALLNWVNALKTCKGASCVLYENAFSMPR